MTDNPLPPRQVTLTTASGHTFTYAMNPVTVANALVKLEQSQLHAEKQAAMRELEQAPVQGISINR